MPAPYPKSKENQEQIIKLVYDAPEQALRVTGDLQANVVFPTEQEVEVSATDGDSIIVAGTTDGSLTGTVRALKILPDGSLATSATSSGGSFSEVSPTDFRASTVTPTSTPTAVTFPSFTMVSISLYAPPDNSVPVRIGKSDVATNYFLLTPGSSVNLPLQASTSPVYYMLDSAGVDKLSILALGS